MNTVGIIGNGALVAETRRLLNPNTEVLVYDADSARCYPPGTTLYTMTRQCALIFVCVPTSTNPDGSCNTVAIEMMIDDTRTSFEKNRMRDQMTSWMDEPRNPRERQELCIVLRTLVPPGTCDRLEVHAMPNTTAQLGMLGEDSRNSQFANTMKAIWSQSDHVYCGTNRAVEMAGYVSLGLHATKIAFFNEMKEYCHLNDIKYDDVKAMATNFAYPNNGSLDDDVACLRHMINETEGMEPFIVENVYWQNIEKGGAS